MSMNVNTKYEGFMATVTVSCDTIDAIDIYDSGFHIDFINHFIDMANKATIKELVAKDEGGTITAAEKETLNGLLETLSAPFLSIGNDTGDTPTTFYCNSDDETLVSNGMQYWINEDKKSMTFRIIPQLHLIEGKKPSTPMQAVVCWLSFDSENVTQFEVCLIPRLITDDIKKPQAADPVLPTSASRVDYEWNDELDKDHLYVNTSATTTTDEMVPMYTCTTSAFVSDYMNGVTFDTDNIISDLYDPGAETSIGINFTSSTFTGKEITLVESYTGSNSANKINLSGFTITQQIYNANAETIAKNKLRLKMKLTKPTVP